MVKENTLVTEPMVKEKTLVTETVVKEKTLVTEPMVEEKNLVKEKIQIGATERSFKEIRPSEMHNVSGEFKSLTKIARLSFSLKTGRSIDNFLFIS